MRKINKLDIDLNTRIVELTKNLINQETGQIQPQPTLYVNFNYEQYKDLYFKCSLYDTSREPFNNYYALIFSIIYGEINEKPDQLNEFLSLGQSKKDPLCSLVYYSNQISLNIRPIDLDMNAHGVEEKKESDSYLNNENPFKKYSPTNQGMNGAEEEKVNDLSLIHI